MAHLIISIAAITTLAILIKALKKKKEIIYGFFTSKETADTCKAMFGESLCVYVDDSNPMELLERVFGGDNNDTI